MAGLAGLVQPVDANAVDDPWDGWGLHLQSTFIPQVYPGFRSPYQGINSLPGGGQGRETWTTTAFIGRRLWEGAELYANPELDQGFGLASTVGAGGFPNGEAQKGGSAVPKPHLHRIFLRQTFGLGGEQEKVEDGANQFGGMRDISRVTLTAGKFSVPDLFDDNTYSHDPRTTFMNWSIWEGGAFDYPADRFGFTWGAVAELNQKSWAVRTGYFLVVKEPNSDVFDTHIPRRGGWIAEGELRYALASQPGKLRLLGFINEANSGSYRETLDDPALGLDLALTRRTRSKYGFVVNAEQAVTGDFGLFSRLSWNDGRNEIMSFTDIDGSVSAGGALKGTKWGRPDDTIGLAGAVNALSNNHRDFIAAGGLGILIGDGRLNYRTERIIEAYYSYSLWTAVKLTFDYQFIANPAYNADRGPVSVFAARLHVEY